MKKFILLGILLLAGLSFAQPPNWNWMEYVTYRYTCNYYYNVYGWYQTDAPGLLSIVEHYDPGEDYWAYSTMETYRNTMGNLVWDDAITGMCVYSGCWHEGEDISVTSFKQSMLGYNAGLVGYKTEFLRGLRAFLSDPEVSEEAKSEIMYDLRVAMAGYEACLLDLNEEENPCYNCVL